MRRRTMRIVNVVTVAAVVAAGFVGSMSAAQAMTAPSGSLIDLPLPDLFGSPAPDAPAPEVTTPAATHLTVTYKADADAKAMVWHLQCNPPGGDHPREAEACAVLDAAAVKEKNPFAEPPGDQICTKIYGGPQTATVEGTWNLAKVDTSFKRSDGCAISRWNAIAPVLEPAADK